MWGNWERRGEGRVGPVLRVVWPSEEQTGGGAERVSWHGRRRGGVQFGTAGAGGISRKH